MVGETVRFVSHSGQIRHDMECGNIKCDAAGRIGLQCQPDQFPHQLRLLHHPIFVINIGRLWIRNHRLGPILPLAQALKPQFQFADARKILIEPAAIAAAGPPLQPARFVEHQIEHAPSRLDPPQRGSFLGRGALHKQGPVESPDARLCRDRHPRSGDRQNVRKRSAVLHAEVERGKPGFVADPLRRKLIERLRVAKVFGQRIGSTGQKTVGRFMARAEVGVGHPGKNGELTAVVGDQIEIGAGWSDLRLREKELRHQAALQMDHHHPLWRRRLTRAADLRLHAVEQRQGDTSTSATQQCASRQPSTAVSTAPAFLRRSLNRSIGHLIWFH